VVKAAQLALVWEMGRGRGLGFDYGSEFVRAMLISAAVAQVE